MDSKPRFVEFIQDDGDKITINTAHIVAIEAFGSDSCAVFLNAPLIGKAIVRGSYAEVKERCLY